MKRLLLTGALAALVSFGATAAQAQIFAPHMTRVLEVTITGTTKADPAEHQVYRMTMPYETSFTCDEAQDRLDLNFILKAAERKFKGVSLRHAYSTCVAANTHI